jgi:DUF1680 family protein
MYAATGNPELKKRIDYMIDWLGKCQQQNGDGYIGGVPGGKTIWKDIASGKINAGSFSLNDKWVPLYNIHKLYAGLYDAWSVAGNAEARQILVRFTDWCLQLVSSLSNEQVQQMLKSEHGGLNEIFADVAAMTGDQKYLVLARKFSHRTILDPLLQEKDVLNGLHANTQIPKVIGFMRIAEVSGDTGWAKAADFFWQTVVHHRTVSIGGNSVREHFHPAADFSSMMESREGPETCNSYNMLKLTRHLFLAHPSASYLDYYERTLYNHILSSQRPGGGFVYFTPMRPMHYRVYSQPQEGFWCCVGSGLENHGKYGELIYAHTDTDVFINLYIASTLQWKEKGISLVQQTRFPFSETSALTVTVVMPQRFALHFRYPSWVKEGQLKISVNGKPVVIRKDAASYVSVDRTWKTGDKVQVTLPMHTSAEYLPDHSQWVSFVHGPVVLAAAVDTIGLKGLLADGSRMGHIANGPLVPLEEAPLLVGSMKQLETGITPVPGKTSDLVFKAPPLIYQEKYKDLQLVPFFQVHDSRYMLYWPYTDQKGLVQLQQQIKEKEAAKMQLEAMTVDLVNCGEQQPESDHHFKGGLTQTGVYKDRHYRNGTGWFSYDLINTDHKARKLRLTYYGNETGKRFGIYINDSLLQQVSLTQKLGDHFVDVDYELPASLAGTGNIQLKLVAAQGSSIASIYEVRLLK